MRNKYIILAGFAILLSYAVYFIRFFLFDGQVLSESAEHWGQFGDFVGGVINPVIGFLTVVILVRQNYELTMEMDRGKRSDYIREFDAIFFNGLDRQKRVFDNFSINVGNDDDCREFFRGAAVVKIEDLISSMRDEGASVSGVCVKIEEIDADNFDKLFEIVRAFYILVVMSSERLDNKFGFDASDRKNKIKTAINFIDFAHVRILLICIQFMDNVPARYLRSSQDFIDVANDLGLRIDAY